MPLHLTKVETARRYSAFPVTRELEDHVVKNPAGKGWFAQLMTFEMTIGAGC